MSKGDGKQSYASLKRDLGDCIKAARECGNERNALRKEVDEAKAKLATMQKNCQAIAGFAVTLMGALQNAKLRDTEKPRAE